MLKLPSLPHKPVSPVLFSMMYTVVMVASLCWTGYATFIARSASDLANGVPALFVTFVLFVLGQRIDAFIALNGQLERDDCIRKTSEAVKLIILNEAETGVLKIGTSNEGLQHLIAALKSDARHIRDTIFRDGVNVAYRNSPLYGEFKPALEAFLRRGGTYNVIGNNDGLKGSTVEGLLSEPAEHTTDNLFVKTIDTKLPLVNLLIIERELGAKEVLFGWDYTPDQFGPVFVSKNPDLIAYFEEVWRLIRPFASAGATLSGPPPTS